MRDQDLGFRRIVEQAKREKRKSRITVGVHGPEGDKQHDASSGLTVSELADIHEHGLGVPRRSFIRGWFDEVGEVKLRKAIHAELEDGIRAGRSRQQSLERLALTIQASIQQRISNRIPPPNHPITIKRKGTDVPLVEHGVLRASVLAYVNGKRPSK